jgi:hypothetical protein
VTCRACGLDHSPLQACSVARRLQSKTVTVTENSVTVTPKTVTVTQDDVTVTSRMAELRKRKAKQGLIALTVWAHPDNHEKIKDFAKSLVP